MKKKLLYLSILSALNSIQSVEAADFVNGDFELGNTSSWTIGGGSWSGTPTAPNIDPSSYLPSGGVL